MATIITNNHNLPQSLVNAVKVDRHVVNGDISVTQLIDAPQVRMLRRVTDTEEDVVDRIAMLMGTAVHSILELADVNSSEARQLVKTQGILKHLGYEKGVAFIDKVLRENYPDGIDENIITEKTMTYECEGWTLSGTVDRVIIDQKTIQDYKTTSVFQYIYKEEIKKYTQQLNIYALMAEDAGLEIDKLEVIMIFKDWSFMESKRNKDYPPQKVMVVEIKRLSNDKIETFVRRRVQLHQAAEGGEIIECTPKERWSSPDTFAVKKKGAKKASRVFPTPEEAEKYIELNKHKLIGKDQLILDHRIGDSKRCSQFCPVAKMCPQRKKELEDKMNASM